jgi:zinc/manganese transport system substrate-binding protein
MKNVILVSVFLSLLTSPCFAKAPLKVVATQAIFADIVRQVGGEYVEVKSVASPKFNIHFIQPKPSDVRNVAKADLYVNGGLDLEAWSDPLLEAAGKPALFRGAERNLDMSKGIKLRKVPGHDVTRAEGDVHLYGNPHFHMNPENAKVMARHVADRLKEVDPEHAEAYEKNAQAFLVKLEAKIAEWKSICSHCIGQEILSYHDDIEYLADFLGLKIHMFLEPKPGIPPSAKHLAQVDADAKAHGIKVIVQPTFYSKDTAEHVAGKIGGKVVLVAQNAGELPGTETVFGFFDTNIKALSEALK